MCAQRKNALPSLCASPGDGGIAVEQVSLGGSVSFRPGRGSATGAGWNVAMLRDVQCRQSRGGSSHVGSALDGRQ